MAALWLQQGVTYGPVLSRRLGRSLGVNLLPDDYKLCSFDCVYCQYGRTEVKALFPEAHRFRDEEWVLRAVEIGLLMHGPDIDTITFSGNGEPTLHPDFPAVVSGVRDLRDRLCPDVRLTIFSNSTTVHLPHIREPLALFDAPIMKLDAGDPATLARINRPDPAVKLEQIVEGLKRIPNLITQSVLIDGPVTNVKGPAFEAWLAALSEIRPTRAQIYSTDRPTAEASVKRVRPTELERIARAVERHTGIQVDAYWAHSPLPPRERGRG
jgi:wyosine [tRNA(Phe)-imidazoG37] synthetase (radical SAM superfamily)